MSSTVLFGFKKYPHNRETPIPTAFDWLIAKQVDDNIGDLTLWRVHGDLYDLNNFAHPGGKSFIDFTKGTDITELFESSHPNIRKARQLLSKFHVKETALPRNTDAFTFQSGGFYDVLRDRVWAVLSQHGCGPSNQIKLIHDSLLTLFFCLVLLMILSIDGSVWFLFAISSGLVLALLANCAHNFFHQKDNWRMYSFDLTGHSSLEWRITHGYSHHMFPNTINDYEVTGFEPFIHFLPKPKNALMRSATAASMVVIFLLAMLLVVSLFHCSGSARLTRIITVL